MPRQARIVIPDVAHHVTQRGNYRQPIFRKDEDYQQYSQWINTYAQKHALTILAYCLMNNHVHFIVVPQREDSLAKVFNTVHMRYAQYINKQKKAAGHLWQGRFFSCALDEAHLYRAMRYVEQNPVRAKIVKNPWDYEWSSAKVHLGQETNSTIEIKSDGKMVRGGKKWRAYLLENDDSMVNEIRLKTQRGLVIGTESFIQKLEKKLGRSLQCLNPGRPWKKDK